MLVQVKLVAHGTCQLCPIVTLCDLKLWTGKAVVKDGCAAYYQVHDSIAPSLHMIKKKPNLKFHLGSIQICNVCLYKTGLKLTAPVCAHDL